MSRLAFMRRIAPAMFTSVVITYESLTKGWLTLWAVPSLLFVIPILFGAQSRITRGVEQTGTTRTIRWAQLVGLLGAYVCLPGVGDTSSYLMFGFAWVENTSLVDAMWLCSLAAGVVAILSTIAIFRSPGMGRVA